MRIMGALLLAVLLAAALVLYLQGRSTHEDLRAVNAISSDLREAGVEGTPMDHGQAQRAINTLAELAGNPQAIADQRQQLSAIANTAARWAAAAPSPSPDLRAAVAIRSAADELLAYGVYGGETHLGRARQHILAARSALAGEGRPADAVGGVRDRLQNLQRSQEEQLRKLDETLKH
jgi:hypothetical protein